MALTKPKAAQVNFEITNISDQLITLNKVETPPVNNATDIGIIGVRGSGENNVAMIWDESGNEFAFIETTEDGLSSGNINITAYADLHANSVILASGVLMTNVVDDLTPQLGGDLDVNDKSIVSDSNTDISIAPGWLVVNEFHNEQKIQASDLETLDYFGRLVVIHGDTAIVGAYGEDTGGAEAGAAYIFTRTNDIWTEQQKIQASDLATLDYFGRSVAIYGDTAIVGASGEDTGAGAAYIFTRTGTTWTEEQKIQASDKETDDSFGYSVAIYGDTVIVGAMDEDTGVSNVGAAYIFTRTGTTWTEEQKIQASDLQSKDYFGQSVAIYGDTVIIGAFREDTGAANAGAAYIFTRTDTTWTEEQKIQSSNIEEDAQFGVSVAIYGDTVIVGADMDDTGGVNAGAAYVFTRTVTTWTEEQQLLSSDLELSDFFGYSVAIYSDTVIVGAFGEDTGGASVGSAYMFTRAGTTWTEQKKLQASDKGASAYFGSSVSIYENTMMVGAYGEDTGGADVGAAYFYTTDVSSFSSIKVGEDGYSPIVEFLENTPGTNFVGLRAPDVINTSRTWVLPQDDPSASDGYFLKTDASGVMSFAVPAGGGMSALIDDANPQLGGNLDVNGNNIYTTANGNIVLVPDGTGTIIISNETALQFSEASGNGTEYVALIAPTSVATSRTWVLPQDDPTTVDGQYMTTDASGVMSFTGTIDGGSY